MRRCAALIVLALLPAQPAHGSTPLVRVGVLRTLGIKSAAIRCCQGLRVESAVGGAFSAGARVSVEASGSEVVVRAAEGTPMRVRTAVVRGGGGNVVIDAGQVSREVRGGLRITARSGLLSIVNEVALEDYVEGVVASEIPSDWPMEAHKAQAVAARSLALSRIGAHASEGFDLCDTTHCQVYRGASVRSAAARAAARATTGQTLVWRGRPIEALYCSTCGGVTAPGFGGRGVSESPFLRARRDELNGATACKDSPHYMWKADVSSARLERALASDRRTRAGSPLRDVKVTSRDASGRAASVEIRGARTIEVDGYVFWTAVCRAAGWGTLKSAHFTVDRKGGDYVFQGCGLGHGVGLCQWGARKRAEAGWDYRRILSFYYPGCQTRRAPSKKASNEP